MQELLVLQAIRLKGRVTEPLLSACTGLSADEVGAVLADTEAAGLVERGSTLRLTPAGRVRRDELLDAERTSLDTTAISSAYDEFTTANTALKEIISAWQVRGPDLLNDHSDAEYDDQVIARLSTLHDGIYPLLGRLSTLVPRLAVFQNRLIGAVQRARAGEQRFVASPIVDSYHQVWFELHQEFIELLGRTREQEAAEGRA